MEIFNSGNFLFYLLSLFLPPFTLFYFWDCIYTHSRPFDFVPRVSEHLLIFFRFPSLSLKNFFKTCLLILVAPGLCWCVRASTGCGEWRLLLIVTRGLLIAAASLVGTQTPGTWASVAAV